MVGRVSEEVEVKVPASEAWKLYGSLRLAEIAEEALPDVISKVEVVEGNGSAGTVLRVFLPPGGGSGGGGALDLGFTLFRFRMEVIEKEGKKEECIVRGSIEFELKEEAAARAAWVSIEPLVAIMQLAAHYLTKNYTTN
ncbi:UNVERIFIED_CONTAM: hypothetical protein Sangu_2965500 [Sesamum angustifolium]|uniref:Uncharacterized protein n=1 Tax=Sesamum angustifolium TaxID=2727405 RepID=A0AAW2IKY3_9LAMI